MTPSGTVRLVGEVSALAIRISGRTVARQAVSAWEDRRIAAAAKKLGLPSPPGRSLAERREALLTQKLALGPDEIMRRLRRETQVADVIGRLQAKVSDRRRFSTIEIDVPAGTADGFARYFETATRSSDEEAMLRACPDHFVIRMGRQGQEVLETNGGSPLAAFFSIDYHDLSSLVTRPDPVFPVQIAGVARASNGAAIGGVRHQFRDLADGFQARLTVEFPLPTLPTMVGGHRWHLACEFSNWIEAALDGEAGAGP